MRIRKQKEFYTKDIVSEKYRENIGDYTYGRPTIIDYGESTVLKIGKYCSIASNVVIFLGGNHRIDWLTTYPFPALSNDWPEANDIVGHPSSHGDVIIGNDVWIGYGAVILSGVNISDGAVIGAFSVVTKDIEPYTVVAGNPAKLIKKRFSDDAIETLLKIKWWNWPIREIKRNLSILCSPDIEALTEVKHVACEVECDSIKENVTINNWVRRLIKK